MNDVSCKTNCREDLIMRVQGSTRQSWRNIFTVLSLFTVLFLFVWATLAKSDNKSEAAQDEKIVAFHQMQGDMHKNLNDLNTSQQVMQIELINMGTTIRDEITRSRASDKKILEKLEELKR